MNTETLAHLQSFAKSIRQDIIIMNCYAGSGHPGGSLSCTDLMAFLFGHKMNFSVDNAASQDRDRFVLSKGHSCLALYAVLAQLGFFNRDAYKELRQVGGMLQGHPDRLKTPGIEFNSGSLGQGFSFALGCALGAKRSGMTYRTYALLGDGELDEGQIWEGMMFGAHYNLDNIVAIVDYNKLQSDDWNTHITSLEPLVDKFKAFGWYVVEIDGHSFADMAATFDRVEKIKGQPAIIIAHTTKGKGVSFMENIPKWHGSLAPQGEERQIALHDVGLTGDKL